MEILKHDYHYIDEYIIKKKTTIFITLRFNEPNLDVQNELFNLWCTKFFFLDISSYFKENI